MKTYDWKGYNIPILAHAFDLSRNIGVDVHLRARTESEALAKLDKKLQKANKAFIRQTEGHYSVKFEKEI
jgi:hypothetical protein